MSIFGMIKDEATWDIAKFAIRFFGGRIFETDVQKQDASGKAQGHFLSRVEKVEFTNQLAQVMAKMQTLDGGPEAFTRLMGYIADAVTGDDPLPGGEDELSKGLACFIPAGNDDRAYTTGAENLIAISKFEREDFYALIRVVTKNPKLEDIKRVIGSAGRLGIDLSTHVDAQFARWATGIRAGTAIMKLKRDAKGKPNPSTTEKDLRDEYAHLTSTGKTDDEIMAIFRARGYAALFERSPR